MAIRTFAKTVLGGACAAVALSAAMAVPAFAAEGVTTMATSAALNMRDAASMNGQVIDVIPQGTSVQVFGMTRDGWYDVEYDGKRGHCYYRYLDFEGSADGTVHDGHETDMFAVCSLNVRSAPQMGDNVVGYLQAGEAVPVVSKHDGWFKVIFKGREAYCYGHYLDFGQTGADECAAGEVPKEEDTSNSLMNGMTSTASLNVRDKPGMDGRVIGWVKQGEVVHPIEEMPGNWIKIEFKGGEGYCYGDYLQ